MNKTVKLLLYCTKAKPYLVFNNGIKGLCDYSLLYSADGLDILNGKIVAEAECDLVEKEEYSYACDDYATFDDDRLEATCLSRNQLNEYGKYKSLYLIYLKNVKPFEKPRKLNYYGLDKAPQNMCFKRFPVPYKNSLGGWEISKDEIIISIRPEWLCKILNREKTIEIRKSILNLLRELVK